MNDIESNIVKLLESIRKSPDELERLCEVKLEERERLIDVNEGHRFKVAIGIFNDFKKSDEFIIKYIFQQEFKCLQQAFKKYNDSFLLIAYLYSLNKSAEKVLDFYNLKILNYDTFCSFEREHLLTGGVTATFAFLANLKAETRKSIQQEIGNDASSAIYNDQQIEDWLAYKKTEFEKYKYPKNIDDRISFLIALKKREELAALVDPWYSQVSAWDQAKLSRLVSLLACINNPRLTIKYLSDKVDLFTEKLSNSFLLLKYLDALEEEKRYSAIVVLIDKKLSNENKRMTETILFSRLCAVLEKSNDQKLRVKCLELLAANVSKLNQSVMSKLRGMGYEL